jgi:3-methyl-2-oxobutanoate hydroxymethyltransferase
MKIQDFYTHKQQQNPAKITMLTCYDYTSARLLAKTAVDCLLVGDSVAMTMHGYESTVHATLAMMNAHIKAVHRGASF